MTENQACRVVDIALNAANDPNLADGRLPIIFNGRVVRTIGYAPASTASAADAQPHADWCMRQQHLTAAKISLAQVAGVRVVLCHA